MTHEIASPELAACEVHGVTRSAFILRGAQAFAATGGGDAEILNFALTLEYLEADFYNVKGKAVGLSGQAKRYAKEFGAEESAHVLALTAAIKQLGGKPVAKPTFVFPATDEKSFLELASVLENTGVGAYNGAGPSLQSKQVLASAGSIVQVEARHAAAIDLLIGKSPTPNEGFDKPLTKATVLGAVKALIKA
jgi:hypothetical protein